MKTEFNCPVCKAGMVKQRGHQLSTTEGVTVFCPNQKCGAQEVSGHGDTEKAAMRIVEQKFSRQFDLEGGND